MISLDALSTALARNGLALRGGIAFGAGEEASVRALLLVGNIGGKMWPHFARWHEAEGRGQDNPLDAWTRQVIEPVADMAGARAVYPFEKPYYPFQRWATRAEGLKPSPFGVLMHPDYGPWHAYRAALLFDGALPTYDVRKTNHACETCDEKPCLRACPVSAISVEGHDYGRCGTHVASPAGAACRDTGCLARNACPVGSAHRYGVAQQAFHQASYVRSFLRLKDAQRGD